MITCPKCNRPIRHQHAWHYCQAVDMNDLFVNKPDEVVLAFDSILSEVEGWENVGVSATKNCIVFLHNLTFLVLKPMRQWLEVKFFSHTVIDDDRIHKCVEWNGKFAIIMRFKNEAEITPAFFGYVKESYRIC